MCSNYANKVHVTDNFDGNHTNYYIPSTWSGNVPNCNALGGCACAFYAGENCSGNEAYASNCITMEGMVSGHSIAICYIEI